MINRKQKYFLRVVAVIFLFLAAAPSFGQDIKRSKKTQIIDGKKYYLHTVERGQTLYAIARAYDLTVNDIVLENPDALNGIKQGMVLKIPAQKPIPVSTQNNTANTTLVRDTSSFFIVKVEAGQTLYSIAKANNTTTDAIVQLNPDAKNGLKTGQELKIPKKNSSGNVSTGMTQTDVTGITGNGITDVTQDTTFQLNKKSVYNIALMLPLQLWNVDNIDEDAIIQGHAQFPPKSEAALQFYEGALIAIDSMKHLGMKINVHVYDMDDGDSAKVQTVLDKPEFKNMDMLIGPLSPGPFYVAAQWAKAHDVAIVSPVSSVNRVLFKCPDAAKALPSTTTLMEQLAKYVAVVHASDNVVMITGGNGKDQAMGLSFKNTFNALFYAGKNDSLKYTAGFSGVEQFLQKDKNNIIVIPSNNQVFITDLLRQLNDLADKYPLIVYGTYNWMSYDNIDADYMENLQLHLVAPYYVNYDTSATKNFLAKYNAAFQGDAGMYAFAGYDVSLFFLRALNDYGTDFYKKLPSLHGQGLQQSFEFFRSDEESGFENAGVHFLRMQDYKLYLLR